LRVALLHDYLNQRGGAERVFAHIARAYPDAPVYTALLDRSQTGDLIDSARVHTSYLARLPGVNRYFRYLAPLYPHAFEAFDLREFDTIISSTTSWAKGVIVPQHAVHVCYINTVSRFAFAYDQYVRTPLARPLIRRLVEWDKRAAQRPTVFVANSQNVAKRVSQYYGRDSHVLHCPVDIDRFTVGEGRGDYFFIASRLLPYKHIERAIRAAAMAGVPLLIAGTGPAQHDLAKIARGTTSKLLGFITDAQVNALLGNARAAILPGEEDFGLVPLEAAACGRPTIAYARGGALETILPGRTGELFSEPTVESLAQAMRQLDDRRYDASVLREHAAQFAPAQFISRLKSIVERTREVL
jgi:glycosyltransferase involved in cell wall biosynthesis